MGVEKREIEVNYAAGDSVRVIDGPLAGFIGVVSSVEPDKNKVDVTVSMFGRETPGRARARSGRNTRRVITGCPRAA